MVPLFRAPPRKARDTHIYTSGRGWYVRCVGRWGVCGKTKIVIAKISLNNKQYRNINLLSIDYAISLTLA